MKILVVDDFSTMRRIIRNLLQETGDHTIDEAEDGVQALRKLRSSHYDFLVTDWNMPNMSGFELLKAVRSDSSLRTIPVLMVTAEAKRDQIVAAAQAGVNGYIIKPFNGKQLEDKMEKIFQRMVSTA